MENDEKKVIRMEAEPGPAVIGPQRRFAVSVMLYDRLGAPEFPDTIQERTDADVMAFKVPVLITTFKDERSCADALAECNSRATEFGNTLVQESFAAADGPCIMLVLSEPDYERRDMKEKPDAAVTTEERPYVEGDETAVKACSRASGIRIVFCHSGNIVQPPFKDEPHTVFLFAHARPPGLFIRDQAFKNLYGMSVWKDEGVRVVHTPTRGRGRLIEESGTNIFQVLGSNYYQLCLTFSEHHAQVTRTIIFYELLNTIMDDLAIRGRSEEECSDDVEDDEFEEFVTERLDERLRTLRETLESTSAEIRLLEEGLAKKLREQQTITAQINALRESSFRKELRERLPSELESLKDIDGVAEVSVVDDGIHLTTESVHLEHDGKTYDIGVFTVRLDPKYGSVEVWNDDPRHPKGHHHPHIDKRNLTCYGNVTTAIAKCMSMYRYADVARIIMRWLHAYSAENTIIPIEEWPSEQDADMEQSTERKENDDAGTDPQHVATA